MTRTPDAHFMVEARYNGTKVVGISPDYADWSFPYGCTNRLASLLSSTILMRFRSGELTGCCRGSARLFFQTF